MKKRNIWPVLVALFGLVGCASSDPEVRALYSVMGQNSRGSSEAWLDRGHKEYAANRCGLAIRYFRNALNKKPDSVPAMNGMAVCYDTLRRFDLSERFYRAALLQNPQSVQTLNNLGYSYYLQNKPDLAVNFLQEASRGAELNPLVKNNMRLAQSALMKKKSVAKKTKNAAFKYSALSKHLPLSTVSIKKVAMIRTGKSTMSLLTRTPNLEWQAAILQLPLPLDSQIDSFAAAAPTSRGADVVKVVKTSIVAAKRNEPQPIKSVLRFSYDEALSTAPAKVAFSTTKRKDPLPLKALLRFSIDEALLTVSENTSFSKTKRDEPRSSVKTVRWDLLIPVSTKKRSAPDEALEVLKEKRGISIEISNGAGRRRMAARMRDYLVARRHNVRWLTNAKNFNNLVSTIFYKSDAKGAASTLANTLPLPPKLLQRETQRASLQLELGGDLLLFDKKLIQKIDHAKKRPIHVNL